MRIKQQRNSAAPADEFLTDPEGAKLLNLGSTKFAELQRDDPDFPPPVRFGPRAKRHIRGELVAYAMRKRSGACGGSRA